MDSSLILYTPVVFALGLLGVFLGNLLQPLAKHLGKRLIPSPKVGDELGAKIASVQA